MLAQSSSKVTGTIEARGFSYCGLGRGSLDATLAFGGLSGTLTVGATRYRVSGTASSTHLSIEVRGSSIFSGGRLSLER
jgi:hypothetical protein